ncbi:MAG TPA: acetyl-CoA carboxylase, carboxyltransferase subunit beta [Opitutales bacterium]|jgi:acetyl-CoA carboxylase carboxyl transferase subunit beta|nr:acetyl-CoA carboxylase, carboxyltransferase subunit beta [Opitutales bacterium]
MAPHFTKPKYSTVTVKKKDIPKGLWEKCPVTGEIVYKKDLEANWNVVPQSGYHFPLDCHRRVALLIDEGTWKEFDTGLRAADPLEFTGEASYSDKLAQHRKKTGLSDAVITGTGTMNGLPISLAVMDFRFLGASMGAVVGEKITRAIERATERKIPVIVVSASGGARMYEGIHSLMQMAKTSAALARHAEAGLPYISILTDPTMAGVMASYASLGDVILAEPGARIGFAGPRVIEETTQKKLPEGFQTAEFLLEHGLIDHIVARKDMKETVGRMLKFFGNSKHNGKTPGSLPLSA